MGVWGSTQNISTSESFGCVVHRKSQVATPGSWQTESKSGYPKMDWFNIWERDKHANSSCGPVSSYWAIPVFPSNPHVFCFEKTLKKHLVTWGQWTKEESVTAVELLAPWQPWQGFLVGPRDPSWCSKPNWLKPHDMAGRPQWHPMNGWCSSIFPIQWEIFLIFVSIKW